MTARSNNTRVVVIIVVALVILLRILVGYQPHSGQDNHHGSHAAYGGDFEAQRHWMELTLHLPLREWYHHDLEYWGLDYPPLSGYVSWVCGFVSHYLVGPESVALHDSRYGYENAIHKAYMRATVIVLDLLIYGTAVHKLVPLLVKQQQQQQHSIHAIALYIYCMVQPAIILIDHGHFQYNTTSLGLFLWSVYYMVRNNNFNSCIVASVLFSLALCFKQMNLYYAPAVFSFLLGRCGSIKRVVILGATVFTVFIINFGPVLLLSGNESDDNSQLYQRAMHIFRRIIPLQRGLFEDKVANIWCVLSVAPFRIRQRIPTSLQPVAALVLTICLFMPSCIKLFQLGRKMSKSAKNSSILLPQLLWAMTSCALSFFLASFQVHEKSILMALAPASLLMWENTILIDWFCIVATWSLWPLMILDRLQTAYICTILIFMSLQVIRNSTLVETTTTTTTTTFATMSLHKVVIYTSYFSMLALHIAQLVYTPPLHLPDLFAVLWSIGGCACCCYLWLWTCMEMYSHTAAI